MDRQSIIQALLRPGMYTGEQGDRTENEWKADAVLAVNTALNEPRYVVMANIEYEGLNDCFYGTRAAIKEWLKSSDRQYCLDDLEIYSCDAPDVSALFDED